MELNKEQTLELDRKQKMLFDLAMTEREKGNHELADALFVGSAEIFRSIINGNGLQFLDRYNGYEEEEEDE